jgi:hypothetical protein
MQLSICKKIKPKCHISAKRAIKEFLPYIRIIFANNLEEAAGLAKWLGLTQEMVENLAGDKAAEILVLMNESAVQA